jgi:hypothetical protein
MHHIQPDLSHRETSATRRVAFAHSPNAVASGIIDTSNPHPSPSRSPNAAQSPRIKIASDYRFDHPHEVDLREFEAEADYKEYVMFHRIKAHRDKIAAKATSDSTTPLIRPLLLPNSHQTFLNTIMMHRILDEQEDSLPNPLEMEEELESEQGIFELDM